MIAECAQCGREMSQVQEVCLWCDRPKVKKRGRRRGGPVDVATFIESTLNPREDGRELTEGMPRSHLKDGHYQELAEDVRPMAWAMGVALACAAVPVRRRPAA